MPGPTPEAPPPEVVQVDPPAPPKPETPTEPTDLAVAPPPEPDPDPIAEPATVSPYRVSITRDPTGRIATRGHMPSAAASDALSRRLEQLYGTPPAPLPIAGGAPEDALGQHLAEAAEALRQLETWTLTLEDRALMVEGVAPSAASRDMAASALRRSVALAAYEITTRLLIGPRMLSAEVLETELSEVGGCGPLRVQGPARTFPLGARVPVSGSVRDAEARAAVEARLAGLIGSRTYDLQLETLNPPVCLVGALLPPERSDDFQLWFGHGRDPSEPANPTGVFRVGDNPLIDIRMPERQSWGHLHVVAVDVQGTVFHLLPNTHRRQTQLARLGQVVGEERRVRVAFSQAQRQQNPRVIAFTVNENSGQSLIVAFHTETPLFPTLRPIDEPAQQFADALRARAAEGALAGAEIVTRILDTRGR